MSFGDYLFTCAICSRDVHDIQRSGKDRHVAPLCRSCENVRASHAITAGAFMDRRKVAQVSALADALFTKANSERWMKQHGLA